MRRFAARQMIAAVAAALSIGNPTLQHMALHDIPDYRSRGKGTRKNMWIRSSTHCLKIGKSYPEAKARRIAVAKAYNERLRNAKA